MMRSPVQRYQREINDALGFHATWLPADRIELGEFGTFKEGRFRKAGRLSDLGVEVTSSEASLPQPLLYNSASGTKIALGVKAGIAVPAASGAVSLDFTESGACVFQAEGVRQRRIENRMAISQAIIELWKKEKWNKDWHLVEDLYTAACATIVVSLDHQASVVLSASAQGLPITTTALANVGANFSVAHQDGRLVTVVGARDCSPLFRSARLKTGWFSDPELAGVPPAEGEGEGEPRWIATDIEDVIDS
jgi:hypothetical protein